MAIPAAQYLRMSTDDQENSIANQSATIARYCAAKGFEIVETFKDPGRSGLTLRNRPGLSKLLAQVVNKPHFQAILVCDVSRWGRFQNADESAHYEFICLAAGVPVHYCAEPFQNDDSLASSVLKSIKRSMAAEYSRELGVKVYEGQKRLASMGYDMGGPTGFGLRRMLISSNGKTRFLRKGERKSLTSDRVVLVPGRSKDLRLIRKIFKMGVTLSEKQIVKELERTGVDHPFGGSWNKAFIRDLLKNPRYLGMNVWGRSSQRLQHGTSLMPRHTWTTKSCTFKKIISEKQFYEVQACIDSRRKKPVTEGQALDDLRKLYKSKGRLSQAIINASSAGNRSRIYKKFFGGLRKAYERVGWKPCVNYSTAWEKRRTAAALYSSVLKKATKANPGSEILRKKGSSRRFLELPSGQVVTVCLCPKILNKKAGARWLLRVHENEATYAVICCRLNSTWKRIEGFELVGPADKTYDLMRSRRCRPGVIIEDLAQLASAITWKKLEEENTEAPSMAELRISMRFKRSLSSMAPESVYEHR